MLPFDVKRAALMTVSGALFAWVGTASVPPGRARTAGQPDVRYGSRSTGVRSESPDPAPPIVIEPLHDWRVVTEPPARSRNLFAFRSAAATLHPERTSPQNPAPAITVPAEPPPPIMKFEGVAEDFDQAGVTRTAIIAAGGQLFLVREGDSVTDRYRVTAVSSTTVDLSDVIAGTSLQLILR